MSYRKDDLNFHLTPFQMVEKKALLTVKQAAYCLNICTSQVYDWIMEGKLPCTPDRPLRIPSAAVLQLMTDFSLPADFDRDDDTEVSKDSDQEELPIIDWISNH